MRTALIRSLQTSALAALCSAIFVGPSAAEKQTAQQVQAFCNQAGGSFILEANGKYSCYLPRTSSDREDVWKYCSADGRCNYVVYCGGQPCRDPRGKRESAKKPGKPKPTKREDGVMTAGTAGDRAGKPGGTTTNLNANFGAAPAKTSSSTGAAGANSAIKPVGAKPSSLLGAASGFRKPGQLAN